MTLTPGSADYIRRYVWRRWRSHPDRCRKYCPQRHHNGGGAATGVEDANTLSDHAVAGNNNPRSGGAFFINAVRELWAREVVSVLDVRLVIRVRLQSVEDDLRAAGKRNVKIAGDAGVFTWVLRGAGREPCEALSSFDHIRDLEAMILTAGMDHLVEMTQHGTFTWRLR